MKKLRLNKIFHWLYAFFMFAPIIGLFGWYLCIAFNPAFDSIPNYLDTFANLESWFAGEGVSAAVYDAYDYLVSDILGLQDNSFIVVGLSYWTLVSLAYLAFDVIMYPINLAHRWIDEGGF